MAIAQGLVDRFCPGVDKHADYLVGKDDGAAQEDHGDEKERYFEHDKARGFAGPDLDSALDVHAISFGRRAWDRAVDGRLTFHVFCCRAPVAGVFAVGTRAICLLAAWKKVHALPTTEDRWEGQSPNFQRGQKKVIKSQRDALKVSTPCSFVCLHSVDKMKSRHVFCRHFRAFPSRQNNGPLALLRRLFYFL